MWKIGDQHSAYGKVCMMRTIEGEPYRFFVKDEAISMIPLDALPKQTDNSLEIKNDINM